MVPSTRPWAVLWSLIGSGLMAGAVWYLHHISPHLPPAAPRENDNDDLKIDQLLEILPWAGILFGTFFLYSGLVRLAFNTGADAIDAPEGQRAGAKYAYWIGFVVVLAAVVLAGIFLLHLKLLSLNRDDYARGAR